MLADPPETTTLPKLNVPSQKATVPDAEDGTVAVRVTGESTVDGVPLETNDTVEAVVAVAVNGAAPVVGVVVMMMGWKDAPGSN